MFLPSTLRDIVSYPKILKGLMTVNASSSGESIMIALVLISINLHKRSIYL